MPFAPISAQNTKLYLMTAPATPALIDGIVSLNGSGGENSTVPGTAISDSNPRTLPGMPSPRTFDGTVNFVPDDVVHAALVAAKEAYTIKTFKLVYSNAYTRYFDGYVMAFGMPNFGTDAPVTSPLKIGVDGAFRAAE